MPIPKNAKKVFTGIIYDVYHWQQKLYDGSFTTFEMLKRRDSVVMIPTVGNKIVMQRQKQPGSDWYICTPSGRMDEGEAPKVAALRELREETGLKPAQMVLWYKSNPTRKMDYTVYVYIARNCIPSAEIKLDGGEVIERFDVTFDEWLKLSDDPTYDGGETLVAMLRARLDPKYKKELKKIIFG